MLWPREDHVTQENCDRIRKGMTRAEVYAILGPPCDYTSGPIGARSFPRGVDAPQVLANEWWGTDTGFAVTSFDRQSQVVVSVVYVPCSRSPQGPLENLMWRIERLRINWYKRRGLIV